MNTKNLPEGYVRGNHWRSRVTALHYLRLACRSALLLCALIWYLHQRITGGTISIRSFEKNPLLFIIWGFFMLEMVIRFFPSRVESPGCQKQFRRNYVPTGRTDVKLHDDNAVVIVALLWIFMNAIFGALHMLHIIDDGIMLLICLAYSVCDVVCILFFCPFQTWFFKNRCCVSCRIYNWDYAMMFTPLFFMPGVYTLTLLCAAAILMLRWEITVWRVPERFSENTNAYLACSNCTEKLCMEKTQLNEFRKELNSYAEQQARRILSKIDKQ